MPARSRFSTRGHFWLPALEFSTRGYFSSRPSRTSRRQKCLRAQFLRIARISGRNTVIFSPAAISRRCRRLARRAGRNACAHKFFDPRLFLVTALSHVAQAEMPACSNFSTRSHFWPPALGFSTRGHFWLPPLVFSTCGYFSLHSACHFLTREANEFLPAFSFDSRLSFAAASSSCRYSGRADGNACGSQKPSARHSVLTSRCHSPASPATPVVAAPPLPLPTPSQATSDPIVPSLPSPAAKRGGRVESVPALGLCAPACGHEQRPAATPQEHRPRRRPPPPSSFTVPALSRCKTSACHNDAQDDAQGHHR
ncbi:hypothetical protein B0H17DRAFT_1194707 [Mycena rosella]|uniref:Uncharacterized protein n=1 Tax=Mycena rosella TaxID=1033263 RepID=A0AAD7DYC7_MYCRO|nr:hypothetical protein B0H17DRAFT_1194707 [Mycena rosella]